MARLALTRDLSESGIAPAEKIMFDSVEKRVNLWPEMVPFYSDANNGPGKTAQAHSTEAVLNAVVLASYDARQGHLRPVARKAFDAAWALQLQSGDNAGGWLWQDFHLAPWESNQSAYQGAALLAVQVGNAPAGYADEPATRPHVQRLRDYLRRQYALQPPINQLYVLWASAKLPGLLTAEERKALLAKLQSLQQQDGGWKLASLTEWKRLDESEEPTESDGTGDRPRRAGDGEVRKAGRSKQACNEAWPGSSITSRRTATGARSRPTSSATRRATSGAS